jgi:F0F1-type ATP synthase assembly protein I
VSRKPTPGGMTLLSMGVTTALCVGIGVGGGYWLDQTFKTGLVLTLVGLVLGVIAAVTAVYLEIKPFL